MLAQLAQLTRAIAALALVLLMAGCATSDPQPTAALSSSGSSLGSSDLQLVADLPPPDNTDNGNNQLIAPNDLLSVTVFQVSDLSRDVQVDPTGRITVPLVGSVQAAGKTLQQLQGDLTHLYGARYLQAPDVLVSMKNSAGQQVTVDGEVQRAGILPTSSQSSLIQVVAQAGGLTKIADANKIFVFRHFAERRLVAQYSVEAIRAGKRPDPRIYGGDIVIVFASGTAIAMDNLRSALGLASSAIGLAL